MSCSNISYQFLVIVYSKNYKLLFFKIISIFTKLITYSNQIQKKKLIYKQLVALIIFYSEQEPDFEIKNRYKSIIDKDEILKITSLNITIKKINCREMSEKS